MVDYKEGASTDNGSENRYINKRKERMNKWINKILNIKWENFYGKTM